MIAPFVPYRFSALNIIFKRLLDKGYVDDDFIEPTEKRLTLTVPQDEGKDHFVYVNLLPSGKLGVRFTRWVNNGQGTILDTIHVVKTRRELNTFLREQKL